MKFYRYILVFSTALFLSVQAYAKSNSQESVTFENYIAKLKEHPQVTAILSDSDKYKELSKGEMGIPDPQITLGMENVPFDNFAFDKFLPTSKTLGFRQDIPSYGLRKARSEKQKKISEKRELLAEYTVKRLKAYLITSISELEKVNRLEKFHKEQLKYYVDLENYLKGQLESGSSVYGRFSEIDIERSEVEQKLNNLKSESNSIESELIRLVGEVPRTSIPKITEAIWDNNTDNIYAVRIAKEDIGIYQKDVDAADSAFDPNYGVQAIYKQREDGDNFSGDDWFSVQATISIPLWSKWKQKPNLRAAEHAKRTARLSYDDVKSLWKKKISILASERDVALENMTLLKEKKTAISEIVSSAERNYEAGNAELESVLDAKIDALTIASRLEEQKSRYIRLSAEFNSHIIGE